MPVNTACEPPTHTSHTHAHTSYVRSARCSHPAPTPRRDPRFGCRAVCTERLSQTRVRVPPQQRETERWITVGAPSAWTSTTHYQNGTQHCGNVSSQAGRCCCCRSACSGSGGARPTSTLCSTEGSAPSTRGDEHNLRACNIDPRAQICRDDVGVLASGDAWGPDHCRVEKRRRGHWHDPVCRE